MSTAYYSVIAFADHNRDFLKWVFLKLPSPMVKRGAGQVEMGPPFENHVKESNNLFFITLPVRTNDKILFHSCLLGFNKYKSSISCTRMCKDKRFYAEKSGKNRTLA